MRRLSPGVAAALALSALAAAGCGGGDSTEKKLFNQQKALCQGLVANHNTQTQGFQALVATRPVVNVFGGPNRCRINQTGVGYAPLRNGNDNCQYSDASQSVCSTIIEWLAADSDLCNFSGGGCTYWCEMRTMASDGPPAQDTFTTDAPVCGVDWESGQLGI